MSLMVFFVNKQQFFSSMGYLKLLWGFFLFFFYFLELLWELIFDLAYICGAALWQTHMSRWQWSTWMLVSTPPFFSFLFYTFFVKSGSDSEMGRGGEWWTRKWCAMEGEERAKKRRESGEEEKENEEKGRSLSYCLLSYS